MTAVGTAGSVLRLGIYNNAGNNTPGTLLVDAGTVSLDAPTGAKSIVINLTLTP
jgi:hypothetical protein